MRAVIGQFSGPYSQINLFRFQPTSEIWSRPSWMEIVPKPFRHRIEI